MLHHVPRIEELSTPQLRDLIRNTHPWGNLATFRERARIELSKREERIKELTEERQPHHA